MGPILAFPDVEYQAKKQLVPTLESLKYDWAGYASLNLPIWRQTVYQLSHPELFHCK